MPKDKYFMMFD